MAVLTVAVVATQMPVNVFPMLLGLIPQFAAAAETLDQSNAASLDVVTETFGGDNEVMWAQTVTAGLAGPLTKVRLPISCPADSNLLIEIHRLAGTVPSGTPVSSQPFTGIASDFSLKDLVFTDPATFTAGERFAIVARETSGDGSSMCEWRLGNNSYTGGNAAVKFSGGAWDGNSDDFAFETYVDIAGDFVVNSSNDGDDGTCDASHCSLREAINAANAQAGADRITFDIPTEITPPVIRPLTPLPVITDTVDIDGRTEFAENSGQVILNGSLVVNPPGDFTSYPGLAQNLVSQSSFRGLVIEAFAGPGITISNGDANTIAGNHIGMDYTGKIARPNAVGIMLSNSTGNTIGGTDGADRNLISGNLTAGIWLLSDAGSNLIQGNNVGLDSAGTTARGNGDGLDIRSDDNVISNNVISGNRGDGIALSGANATGNTVTNNSIGPGGARVALPNGGHGISILGGAAANIIGGALPSAANFISANAGDGIHVAASGTNSLWQNSIYDNGGAGIAIDGAAASNNHILEGSINGNAGKGIALTNGGNGGVARPAIMGIVFGSTLTVTGASSPDGRIQVYADQEDEGITFLGSARANLSGNWSIGPAGWAFPDMTAVITALRAGTLTLHATQTVGQNTSEFSGAISAITGIARCGETTLPGATVELYSGSLRLDSRVADLEFARYSFTGTAPNSTYLIKIRKSVTFTFGDGQRTFTFSCAVTVVTDADGNATAGPGVSFLNRHNHIWPTAFQVASGVPITDYIYRSGQSTWFKIPVRPGQRVLVKVTNVPANYSVALYKDIRALYDEQLDALADDPLNAIANLDASIAPDALSPDELSPDELSPDELSPDELSPDELSPDELSPDELSPDELSPDELSPDALSPDELSPDELSPDELSPDELSPDAYAAAQTAALIGVSAHVGLSPEQIARNTWDNSGDFYIRVRGHNGAFDASRPFTIEVKVTDVSCTGVTLTDTPITGLSIAATARQTIMLTNTAQFAAGADTAGLLSKLSTLAARPGVAGAVVDLRTFPGVASAYTQWNAHQDCPAAANVVARRIKDVIDAYRATNPGLKYVVIAGSDHVVPFFRNPDQSGLGSEKDYRPAVQDPTASQASLRLGYVLTQDFYGSINPISRFDHELYLPDLAVGRLVESISDMSAVIDAFIATNGTVAPSRALVTGYDFLADAAGFIADQFTANALTVDRQLIQPVGEPPSGPNAWTATQLRAKLFGATTFGILSLNSHFSANTVLAADYATRVLSSEVSALPPGDTRFRNALILSTGCHSAYNIVDAEATALTPPIDWTQAFAARGATVIGGTGYQYGDTDFMKYSEKILADTALELRYGSGPVPIGVALANAKRTYVSSLASLKGIDEKALAEATLYGLPMLGYDLPASGRIPAPTTGGIGTRTSLTSPGLSYATLTPTYTLHENVRPMTINGIAAGSATYYDIDGNVAVSPEAPVLPQTTNNVGAAGQAVRGVLLESATYLDQPGLTPFTDVATTEVRGAHPRYVTDVFTPVRPFDLNHFAGSNLITTPFQYRSTDGGTTGVGRRFTAESFRLYYSSLTDTRALAAAPVVYTVELTPNLTDATKIDVNVTVGGLAAVGIEQVWVTYTAESGNLYGSWASLELTRLSTTTNGPGIASRYRGSIARGSTADASPQSAVRALIQAVGGNGLVTWASNDGSYYRVVDETATTAQPKATTALSLVAPTTGTYLSTVPVRARLTSADVGVNGKRLSFRSGGVRVDAFTATDPATGQAGWASAQLPLVSAPGAAAVSVGFAEDATHLGSGADAVITVTRAISSFVAADTTVLVGGSVLLATLMGAGEPLGGQLVTLTGAGRTVQTFTDGYGRIRIDTLDGLPAGGYSVTIAFAGNDRYTPAASVSVAVPRTFVTAGGWILIPADALNLTAGKKTNFSINAKYKTGDTVPSGSFEFQAKESNVTFKATSFDSMTVNGLVAEVQGRGTLNGTSGWTFRVRVVEGSPDTFAVTIWKDGLTTFELPSYRVGNTALGGGNVVVH